MKKYILLISTMALMAVVNSCDPQFEPQDDNHVTKDYFLENGEYAEGYLDYGYVLIPTYNGMIFDEVATDDAVTNVSTDKYLKVATGGWTSSSDPASLWDNCYKGILNIDQFLEMVDEVSWKKLDAALDAAYRTRLKGEAYALRGILKYYLLRNHGGMGSNGQMLGVPIYNEFVSTSEGFHVDRPSFDEYVASVNADFDEALKYLPETYENVSSVPSGPYGSLSVNDYNTVCGADVRQRVDGRDVRAFKARLALLAASPAFNTGGNTALWENAANLNGQVLQQIGGLANLDPEGHKWYVKEQIDEAKISQGDRLDTKEMIWRRSIQTINTWEANNYPPSLYGKGQVNPTQNLVDAFPMKNGYPITDSKSGYDPQNPYKDRDPRLDLYIVHDGSTMRSTTINTLSGNSEDVTNAVATSTRTGYYMRKLLREDVNMDPKATTSHEHIFPHIRATELFLNYAEAANEAWGPTGNGSTGFSAKDVIAAIRKRAGIEQPDAYLQSVSTKEDMRTLIRNERRLELCFESFRFWDLRRWNANLNETAKGIRLNNGQYESFNVEERNYSDYMIYGPIPYNEVLKFNYVQNKGW